MKILVTLLITVAALASQAQTKICTVDEVKKEVRTYLILKSQKGVEFVGTCLQEAMNKEIEINSMMAQKSIKLQVLNVIASIKQEEMAAQVKCESTNTPGCGEMQDGDVFSSDDLKMLERDADMKRSAERKAHEQGLGVED